MLKESITINELQKEVVKRQEKEGYFLSSTGNAQEHEERLTLLFNDPNLNAEEIELLLELFSNQEVQQSIQRAYQEHVDTR